MKGRSSSARRTLIIPALLRFPIWREVSLVTVSLQPARKVAVIGAALDLGQGRRGVDMGPSAIRYAGLAERLRALGREPLDWGNVHADVPEALEMQDAALRFLPEIKETCERIARLVKRARDDGQLPLVLGGDHSVAIGSLGGLASVHGPGGVIWIDAHGDLNRPDTTPSGNVHGMVLGVVSGRLRSPCASIQITPP